MSEADAMRLGGPHTRDSLERDLRALGVQDGGTVLVHSSLSRCGYVVGGAHTVVLALLDAVGPSGTLVMPTHSSDLSEPSNWGNPPAPPEWWEEIRRAMPAFDPVLTPTRSMGAIVDCFRRLPKAIRSDHPHVSFAAAGPQADFITSGHALDDALGEGSPLARLHELDAQVLLLGVGHGSNTSLHLGEYRSTGAWKTWRKRSAPVHIDGERQWLTWTDLEVDAFDFREVGDAFDEAGSTARGRVGSAACRVMRQRALVDFAADWFARHRTAQGGQPLDGGG